MKYRRPVSLARRNKCQQDESAKKFLMEMLNDGEKSQKVILTSASEMDFSKRTLDEAKKALKIISFITDDSWHWKLPE